MNRAASARRRPIASAATIVAPDRDTPGMSAIACAQPIQNASVIVSDRWGRSWAPIRSAAKKHSAPAASAIADTGTVRMCSSICALNSSPAMTAGIVPMTSSQIMRASSSIRDPRSEIRNASGSAAIILMISARKYTTTASRVPMWHATSNDSPNLSPSKPKNARARIRCAVLETGRNSVRPWTMPRSAAWITKRERSAASASAAAAAAQALPSTPARWPPRARARCRATGSRWPPR